MSGLVLDDATAIRAAAVTLRSPQEKMPQREACREAGFIATRLPDGKSVRFKKMPRDKRIREIEQP